MVVVGRIQEQHPERCRLFMQWQAMDWPILIDPLNLLELAAVPIVTGIDEHGSAQNVTLVTVETEFIRARFAAPDRPAELLLPKQPDLNRLKEASADGDAEAWGEYGAALFLWGGVDRIDDAVAAFRRATALAEDEGWWHFRLGVCLRRRHESVHRQSNDFQEAVIAWGRALALDPNQYIWRRRIQQYGPRLDKPYPFYDWMLRARDEIRKRGQIPAEMAVEPVGAEYAAPLEALADDSADFENPDPDGKIHRDQGRTSNGISNPDTCESRNTGIDSEIRAYFSQINI